MSVQQFQSALFYHYPPKSIRYIHMWLVQHPWAWIWGLKYCTHRRSRVDVQSPDRMVPLKIHVQCTCTHVHTHVPCYTQIHVHALHFTIDGHEFSSILLYHCRHGGLRRGDQLLSVNGEVESIQYCIYFYKMVNKHFVGSGTSLYNHM